MGAQAKTAYAAEGSVALDATRAPIEVRSRFVTTVVLRIVGLADADFVAALDRLLQQAPHFFVNAPIVLDIEKAEGLRERADFLKLVHRVQSRRLQVIGVQNWTPDQKTEAIGAGLVALPKGSDKPAEPTEARPADPQASAPAPRSGGLLITEPVRSGQVVFADGGDLIVVAPVSSGAELVAAGSIHVYGRLSGRALAGVNGDGRARIFCQSLEADLIAIAGLYQTSENMAPALRGSRIQAYLDGESLKIDPLK